VWLDRIRRFYDNGVWTKEMVNTAVGCGKITVEEYEEIVGEEYAG